MKHDRWSRTKKVLAVVTSALLWIISIVFSYQGFNLNTNDNLSWVGIVMALSVTVLELVFNTNTLEEVSSMKINFGQWILVIGGALAYIYDIWTNILGVYAARGMITPTLQSIDLTFIVPFLVGTLIAILPEPLFIWGITSYGNEKKSNSWVGSKMNYQDTVMSRLPRRE